MNTTCPACPGRLHTATIGGVDRAQCDGCGGLWFERRKLEKALGGSLPSFGISETSARTCPKTGEQLLASTVEGVTLDWCATCAGVYLGYEARFLCAPFIGGPCTPTISV